jgi:predicted nucleotide-binding protein (sugar kinase/HSP70/actin superfamily)
VLFGGLTNKHEAALEGSLQAIGLRAKALPPMTQEAYNLGKEHANHGLCNPTYWTLGSLLTFLRHLEAEEGLSRERVSQDYIFLTPAACGPCRFGMYESEYRMALRSAGYPDFRVIPFYQGTNELAHDSEKIELHRDLDFIFAFVNAVIVGDLLSQFEYSARPYEVVAGTTDRVLEEALGTVRDGMREIRPYKLPRGATAVLSRAPTLKGTLLSAMKLGRELMLSKHCSLLRSVRDGLGEIEVDRLRVKPVVKIVGEFWAQTTEGDGNFQMFRFLEQEGAEVRVDPVTAWLHYLVHIARESWQETKDVEVGGYATEHHAWARRVAVALRGGGPGEEQLASWRARVASYLGATKAIWYLKIVESLLVRQYERIRASVGTGTQALVRQHTFCELAQPHYHILAQGGEGHLEVGKSIYYTQHKLCHMVLSLKPFGCLPSTQSDGVHAAVTEKYPEMMFLPVETAGEGRINAYSRVQMVLSEAKVRAQAEFDEQLEGTGYSLNEIRSFVAARPELRRATYDVPRSPGVAGTAANFVRHVGRLMDNGY